MSEISSQKLRRLSTLCDIGFELAEKGEALDGEVTYDGVDFSKLDPWDQWSLQLGYRMYFDIVQHAQATS